MNKKDSCANLLYAIENKSFESWKGLNENCTLTEFQTYFEKYKDEFGNGFLGINYIPTKYLMFKNSKHSSSLRVWLKEDSIVKIDLDYPEISGSINALIDSLGVPDIKLDYDFGGVLMEKSEWVYLNKGISLFFNTEKTAITKLSVFPSITLDNYLNTLHINQKSREH